MLSCKQQFFLLLAVFLGISSCSTEKAISRDSSLGLSGGHVGSQISSETVVSAADDGNRVQINHGDGILSKESSVLDLEENEVESAESDSSKPVADESPQAQGQNANAQPNAQVSEPARDDAQMTSEPVPTAPSTPLTEVRNSELIERSTQEPPNSMNSQDSNPVDSKVMEDVSSKSKSKSKKTSNKKKKSRPGKSASDETVIETAPSRFNAPSSSIVAPVKPPSEEALLSKLVKELEFGTLLNSITFLNQLVAKYPEDPDYRSLLAMAVRLRDGDVWYQYQRKVEIKEDKEPKPPVQIMKPTANETVNELKKSSWFLIRSAKR